MSRWNLIYASPSHAGRQFDPQQVVGNLKFPSQWTVFAPLDRHSPELPVEMLSQVPQGLQIDGREIKPAVVAARRSQHDFQPLLGEPPHAMGRVAWVFVTLHADRPMTATLGMGWDHWLGAWLNGQPLLDDKEVASVHYPPSIHDQLVTLDLQQGANVLALRLVAGRGACILALGGPDELRHGDTRSLLDDAVSQSPRWSRPELRAQAHPSPAVEVGTRRELFVDGQLIDSMTGVAQRRLHHPQPREVVLALDRPWEGNFSGNFMPVSIVKDHGRWLFYYYAANWEGSQPAHRVANNEAKASIRCRPVTCVATTTDGIHFTRPGIMLHEAMGSRRNNIVWTGRQYFTPFRDDNPQAPADQRFKAISRHPKGGLGAYASPDGIHWRLLEDQPIITKGAFDSQNLAFWDGLRQCYVEYHRGQPESTVQRGIMTSTSPDFLHWTEPQPLVYADDRPEHMYTNCIAPYARAPHLYLGTPARFVPTRTKDAGHMENGISDAILMSSRDGRCFERWEEGFIRPGMDITSWTDRNNYPAWGMVQSSPEELSLYWCERNGHEGLCLRRGVLRVDGFASLHAPGHGVGEVLTRPMVMAGRRLEVNYATSAIGTILFELCDEQGKPIEGFSLADSEVLFGNAIDHVVAWRTHSQDLGHLAGRAIRLRLRMQDADVYAIRFTS